MIGGGQRRPDGRGGERAFDLRRVAMAAILALLAQFLLGLAASLWVTIGPVRPWSHISDRALFAAHGLLGAAIAAMALIVLSRSVEATTATKLWATIALVGVLAALVCGLEFVSSGARSGWSFGMGVGWAVALLANVRLALIE